MIARACTGHGGRGCPCPFHAVRRAASRRWQQQRRDRELAARNRGATTCQRRAGSGRCGAILETITDGNGRTAIVCPACERRKRGICRDCPRPVKGRVGSALRCAEHKERARQEQVRASELRHHEERLRRGREYYQRDEERRRRRNEYKRQYRKLHPDKVRAQKKRYVEKYRADPNSRYNRYHARYRKKHHAYYQQLQAEKDAAAREHRPVPVCRDCGKPTGWTYSPGQGGRPWLTCMKCCWPHQRRARRRTMRERQKAIAADPTFGLPPKPVKARKPQLIAPRGPGRERLCLTTGCDIVVTHRKKKCTRCRRREAETAAAKLAAHRGRGRRTDLERVA